MPFLLIIFIAVPIIEIALFIQAGGLIGLWPTLAIIVLTALVGTGLVRHQGLETLTQAQQKLNSNIIPAAELLTGLCILLAGAFLITPGFLTDSIGFLLLFAPFRRWAGRLFVGKILKNIHVQTTHRMHTNSFSQNWDKPPSPEKEFGKRQDAKTTIISADYEEIKKDNGQK